MMEPGQLTKVTADFFTTIDGELSLTKGDYFLIYNVIDKHWCDGVSRNKRGKFPSNYLHKVDIPNASGAESLFISIAPFRGEHDGDLTFAEGEIVIGVQEVEPGWWSGSIGSRTGIFPFSHVWLLDSKILKKPQNNKTVRRQAKVKTSLKAQLDEELDLTEGTIVTVVEILDDGWVRGITADGRTGTFPESFVTYIEDSADCPDEGAAMADPIPPSIVETGKIYKDFGQTPNVHHTEEAAPSYYDLFPGLRDAETNSVAAETDADNLNPLGVKPYAITLYPFNAQFPNELNFEAGEIVHLIRHIDSEWAEGNIDSEKGIFPTSYVNIIVDCSEENRIDSNIRDEHQELSRIYDQMEAGVSVKVVYTFNAQMSGDLSVKEGDTVTIVEMANDDWVSVKNDDGEVGLCPRGYLSHKTEPNIEVEHDPLDDFVMIRTDEKISDRIEEQTVKEVSEPHRPAPPAPAPGSIPLQKQSASEKSQLLDQESTERNNDVSESELAKQKRAEKRQNVISELVITEKEYVRDLKVTYETFNLHDPSILESRGIDVTVLFGNILEVIHVAEELLDSILKSMKGQDEDSQIIAPCFLQMTGKLQTAYGKYCGNHEAALTLLKKYEENRDIMTLFEKGIETLRHQVVCFDMSSILIKPVQRILKYPLMLHELTKCTEEDHPDRAGIEEASSAMTAVASYINEYKRRKDIVSKYLDTDNTLMRKMAKLNMHSVAKKSSRLSAKLSASLGLTNMPPDHAFEEVERQFKALEKCTWQLITDIDSCMTHLTEETVCGGVLSEFLCKYHEGSIDKDVERFNETRIIIASQFIKALRDIVEKRVNEPITSLLALLQGPLMLITKRFDKLLDYDNAISRAEKNKESRVIQEELADAKNNYEALNQQLLEELPILIDASTSILVTCIEAFTNARKLFNGRIMKRYLILSESATQVTPQDILQSFLVNHNLLWNQITRFNSTGVKQNTDTTTSELSPQTERERALLTNKYSRNNLFIAKESIASTSSLDLAVSQGSIIAVIKKQDPMGDSSRWFVDNGSMKGFIPSRILGPLPHPRSPPQQNNNDVVDSCPSPSDLMSLDSPVREIKNNLISLESPVRRNENQNALQSQLYRNISEVDNDNQQQRYANVEDQFYYAEYDFPGNSPQTLAAKRGRVLKLLIPHDDKQNQEWWWMEDRDGKKGYFPSNYLSPLARKRQSR